MKKGIFNDSTSKYYIIKQPTSLNDLDYDEMNYDDDASWRMKSKALQARRWRKIKNQLA
jgi:hypothetical protein